MRPPLRPDTLRGEFIGSPSFHDEERGSISVEGLGGAAFLGAVAAVGPLEVVEAQPGLEIGVYVGGRGVEAVAEGRAVVQVSTVSWNRSTKAFASVRGRMSSRESGGLRTGTRWWMAPAYSPRP